MTETKMVEESAQDLTADLAVLRADVARLSDSVATLVKEEVADKKDMFYGAVDSARQKLFDGASDAKVRFSGASSDLEASIERNPLTAVLIAMGAGLVIGLVSRGGK